jgi:drug/metabolite transporter (DMT)-like permease
VVPSGASRPEVSSLLAALAVVTISSLGFAALDALRKSLSARVQPVPLAALLALGQLPLFAAWAALGGESAVRAGYVLPGAATVLLNVVANVLFLQAVRVSPLSVTIPFLSFTPVFSTLLGAAVLGERPGPSETAGIVLVVAGALLVNLRRERPSPLAALRQESGSLLMCGTALAWSLTAVLDKRALGFADVPMHAAIQCAGVAGLLLVFLAARGRLGELGGIRSVRGTYAVALVAAAVGLGLQFVALRLTLVGLVESLKRAIGMLFAVAVGRVVFGEPPTPGKIAGVLLMSAGVALIVL